MKIYVIKIVVRGVSPMVGRRLRIAADTSLAALHFIFQTVQGWGDDHLHQFHIYGKDYGISYEGGIGFPDNPFRIVIDDFAFDIGDRFTYEYNFFERWLHDIRVEAIHEDSMLKTPFCINGHGMPGATADGLNSNQILINTVEARVHLVSGFVFITVPGIFYLYLKQFGLDGSKREALQEDFERLDIHRRIKGKRFYFAHLYETSEHTGAFKRTKGYLVKASLLYRGGNLPDDSPVLVIP